MSNRKTIAPVLSVVGNSGVRVERVEPDDHNKQITVWVDEPDALVRNAAQRLAQKVAPPGWTVRVDAMRERRGPVVLREGVESVSSRSTDVDDEINADLERASGDKRLGILHMINDDAGGD
jgi:hypothetical protein